VCELRVATSESWKDKNGQRQERTEWHRVVVWGKTAEICAKYLAKGRQVYIEGRIQTRSYDDKEGQKRYITEVIANDVQFLSSGRDGGGGGRRGADDGPPPPEPDFGGGGGRLRRRRWRRGAPTTIFRFDLGGFFAKTLPPAFARAPNGWSAVARRGRVRQIRAHARSAARSVVNYTTSELGRTPGGAHTAASQQAFKPFAALGPPSRNVRIAGSTAVGVTAVVVREGRRSAAVCFSAVVG
jgi:single-strand DNA-binding protein